jgi:hypothetical protein
MGVADQIKLHATVVVKTAGVGEAGMASLRSNVWSAASRIFCHERTQGGKASVSNRLRAYRRNDAFAETK